MISVPESATHVALLRGINVGRAKRIAMADLRSLVAELGFGDVRTLLNSGNVVFTAAPGAAADAATRIESAIEERCGFASRVIALTAAELAAVVDANPLTELATNPSRLLVPFLADAEDRARLEPLTGEDWSPEAIALGPRCAYLWCPEGILSSRLPEAVGRAVEDRVTARNWGTVLKLHAMAGGG